MNFNQPNDSLSDVSRSIESLTRIQGTEIFTQDGLYLMTQYGNYNDIFEKENQAAIDNPLLNQTWRHCSVFNTITNNEVFMGRNWDNQTVGSIIVSLFYPENGYASISFSRSIDIGFGHKDLEELKSGMFANKFLLAPFYATDGINEHGLAVAVAGNNMTEVKASNSKKPIFMLYLIRKILDQTKSVDEAVALVEEFVPFDLDEKTLCSHLIVADQSGHSVIMEYDGDKWDMTYPDTTWQIMTTRPIYNVPDSSLRENCWRYHDMSESLEKTDGQVDWWAALQILRDVSQKGTAWSVVYALKKRELNFSVYKNWDTIYHLALPAKSSE